MSIHLFFVIYPLMLSLGAALHLAEATKSPGRFDQPARWAVLRGGNVRALSEEPQGRRAGFGC